MQQKLLLSGNGYKYKSIINNARQLIYKHYPKTRLLTNDEYCPNVESKVKQIELKPDMFYVLLKAFLNSFVVKTPLLIKEDPYACGLDSAYSMRNVKEQKEVTDNDLFINETSFSGSNLYDLYLDAYKKIKKMGDNIIPNFTVQENSILSGNAFFSFNTTDIAMINRKYSTQLRLCIAIDSMLDAQFQHIPEELKEKIKNLSPQDKAKFIHFFKKCLIIHEMQHYKQFVTMLKVYGVEGFKNIMIESTQKQKTEFIDRTYKQIVLCDDESSDASLILLNYDEKVEEIKKHLLENLNLQMESIQHCLEGDGNKKNSDLFNIILEQYNKIKNSENLQEIQGGIKIILLNLEEIYNSIAPNNFICANILSALKIFFEIIMTKHITFQEYFESIWQENLQQSQINIEQYQKIYDSVQEQLITKEEREKAEIYKNAFINYITLDVDTNAYYLNELEIEAYTVQTQAAFEKLEEYNERHKGEENKY